MIQPGDSGWIPRWGRSSGEGNGNPFLYSCLGDTIDRGACGLQSLGSQKVEYSWAQHIHFALRLDSYPSIETERQRCSLLGDHTSKGWLTGAWEKYFLAAKLARGWKKIYISKQQRKKFQLQNFLNKCSKKREVRSLQSGRNLRFSYCKRNTKSCLVTGYNIILALRHLLQSFTDKS